MHNGKRAVKIAGIKRAGTLTWSISISCDGTGTTVDSSGGTCYPVVYWLSCRLDVDGGGLSCHGGDDDDRGEKSSEHFVVCVVVFVNNYNLIAGLSI